MVVKKKKKWRTSHSFQEQELQLELGEMMTKKTREKQQEDNSEGDICYLENICRAGQT